MASKAAVADTAPDIVGQIILLRPDQIDASDRLPAATEHRAALEFEQLGRRVPGRRRGVGPLDRDVDVESLELAQESRVDGHPERIAAPRGGVEIGLNQGV